jgi:hypothetical protein
MPRVTYEVRVLGDVRQVDDEAFADFTVVIESRVTVISGEMDQARLHGLIERVRTLGLELVEIRRTRPAATPRPIEPPGEDT